jgi:RimJ/RimL family protein N-acetyltransferase
MPLDGTSSPSYSAGYFGNFARLMMKGLVYRQYGKATLTRASLPEGYEYHLWCPGLFRVIPRGLPCFPFAAWWLLHIFRVFSNRGYGVLLIYYHAELVHRTVVFPRYFRFPFMGQADLQIGNTWTAERYRGQNLAGFAIQAIRDRDPRPDRVYWYVCEESNIASIRVVEKLGFRKVGDCLRVSRFGMRMLGAFMMTDRRQFEVSEGKANDKIAD